MWEKRPPNIVLIFADDLGYGDLGCYGSKLNDTPVLDEMAKEGIRFTDFYVSAAVCSPSRASLMTGCYSQRVGLARGEDFPVLLPGDNIGISEEEITIAKMLKKAGYKTICIGKWHLGDQPSFLPTRHGFDNFFGLPYSNDMWPHHPENDKFDFPPLPLMRDEEVIEWNPDQATLTKRYTEESIRFIEDNQQRPFFLYFPHMYVHLPLYATEEFRKNSSNGMYGAAVECIDWSIGEIMNTLNRLGLEEDTLVIFTSDNGSNCRNGGTNQPLRGTKGTTWEGGLRMPCIMKWPSRISPGLTCSELITAMDFLPTFAKIVGVELDDIVDDNKKIDGKDITPLIYNQKDARSPYQAFYYYRGYDLEAVRSGRWKLHLKRDLLYDLEEDIGEQNNLYSKNPEVVKRLQVMAEKCRQDLGDGRLKGRNIRQAGKVNKASTIYDTWKRGVSNDI